jgi:hypothetical protein
VKLPAFRMPGAIPQEILISMALVTIWCNMNSCVHSALEEAVAGGRSVGKIAAGPRQHSHS